MPSISFVICTIEHSGREERLREVIAHLRRQTIETAEIILVWQGRNPAAAPVIQGVRVVPVAFFSSSQARNVGASHAQHDLLCFLDDDTYPVADSFALDVISVMRKRQLDFLTCNIASSGVVMAGEAIESDVTMDRKTIIPHMWEPGLTIARAAFLQVGFDPTIGIGCIHGSSEGFDLGYRLLAAGFRGQRVASLLIDHPPLDTVDNYRVERAFYYSLGNGAVLVQHGYHATYAWQLAKTLARMVVSLMRGDRGRTKASFVRSLCMVVGPFIPRRPARILPLASILVVQDHGTGSVA